MTASSVPLSIMSNSSPTIQAVRHCHVRVPELDGVLAIAISFGWFLLHGFFASQPPSMPKLMQLVIGHGWLGVDLFFVLSGFLITGILLDPRGRSITCERSTLDDSCGSCQCISPLFLFVLSSIEDTLVIFCLVLGSWLTNFASLFHVRLPHGPSVLWSLRSGPAWPASARTIARSRWRPCLRALASAARHKTSWLHRSRVPDGIR